MLVTSRGLEMAHHLGNVWMRDGRELLVASHLLERSRETQVLKGRAVVGGKTVAGSRRGSGRWSQGVIM